MCRSVTVYSMIYLKWSSFCEFLSSYIDILCGKTKIELIILQMKKTEYFQGFFSFNIDVFIHVANFVYQSNDYG